MNKIQSLLIILACLTGVLATSSCEEVDDDRIPYMPVYIDLGIPAYWQSYGVHYLGDYKRFIKEDRVPSDFHYNLTTETGFGGVLLVTAIDNIPLAYDLACPVEIKRNVRVNFNPETRRAVCPKCHSEFDVCEFGGSPVSGEAKDRKWALRRYQAIPVEGGYKIVQR